MRFELEDAIYESYLQHAQIEITGCCNMHCKHCRAADEASKHLTMEEINKILNFINKNREENFRITVSGGEPFIHPQLVEIIENIKNNGIEDIIITSNASLITDEKLKALDDLKIKNFCIQVSLDSVVPEKHDEFRGFKGAYDGAIKILKKIGEYDNIKSSIRMTVTHDTLHEVERMIDMAFEMGVERVGIGAVIPVGAGGSGSLTLSKDEKKEFLELLARKKKELGDKLDVTTEDPLKFNVKDSPWNYCEPGCVVDKSFFGGCTAGVTGFNVNAEGVVTPCAVLFEPIINIHDYDTVDEMTKAYENSEIVRNLMTRNFEGKCGKCPMNRICGGCRATAKGLTGNYMGSDITCWRD